MPFPGRTNPTLVAQRFHSWLEPPRELWGAWRQRIDIILVLLGAELKIRYRGTFLGYAWSVLQPLALALIFFFVFRMIVRIPVDNYFLVLITGLFPWQWLQNSTQGAARQFLDSAPLIKRIGFPRWTIAVGATCNDLVHFVLALPVVGAMLLWHGVVPSAACLGIVPVLLLLQFLLTLGLALSIGTLNVLFRDLERILVILMTIWLYTTPVLYPSQMLPPGFEWIVHANPAGGLVQSWRDALLTGAVSLEYLIGSAAWATAILVVGAWCYTRFQWRLAEYV